MEFRFGPPLWGIPTETNRIEFPFVSIHNIPTNKYLATELSRLGEDKTIYVLIPKRMELEARSVFARLEYLWDDKISPDRISHKFGLTGKTSSVSESQVTKETNSKKTHFSYPPLEFVGKSERKKIKEEVLVASGNLNGSYPETDSELSFENSTEVSSFEDESPNHPYDLIESSFAEEVVTKEPVPVEVVSKAESTEPKTTESPELHTLDGSSNTKFSLQLKMMGVISFLFALSVGVIIFFASFYFKRSIELQLRDNNIRIAEIIGSKVKSDILGVVEKGRQIAITLTTQGLPEAERRLLIKTFFQNDKEFIYLGIFEKRKYSHYETRGIQRRGTEKKFCYRRRFS